jgi:hypothetical protein
MPASVSFQQIEEIINIFLISNKRLCPINFTFSSVTYLVVGEHGVLISLVANPRQSNVLGVGNNIDFLTKGLNSN